jgi:hypothetical protein
MCCHVLIFKYLILKPYILFQSMVSVILVDVVPLMILSGSFKNKYKSRYRCGISRCICNLRYLSKRDVNVVRILFYNLIQAICFWH